MLLLTYWYIVRPKTSGACVVIVHEDRVLLVKTTYGNAYSLPGGGIKKGESPHDAAIREVYEEVGIRLTEVTPFLSFVTYEEYKEDTVHCYFAKVTTDHFKVDTLEIDVAEWHQLNNLPKLGSVTQKIIDAYKNK
jgi:8-oxo-dGTP pyrophosphatase MutT (NUDIX family)